MNKQNHTKKELDDLLVSIQELHFKIRDTTRKYIAEQIDEAASVTGIGNGDVSYSVDTKSEDIIKAWFEENPPEGGAIVISEGIGKKVFPIGLSESDAYWRIIIDPLDGTRHIMYDNRSCWILTGIAPNKGDKTSLRDIVACVQTEVPVALQSKGLVITAIRGNKVRASIYDFDNGSHKDITLQASKAKNLENGFAVLSNFFPGTKEIISRIEDHVMERLYGTPKKNGALVFSEQYICNAGQLYMVASGKYRMVADIRAALDSYQRTQNKSLPLCTHPYDLAASLIAEELGCILVDLSGNPLDYPLDTDTNCVFICYANADLFRHIHPVFLEEFTKATGSDDRMKLIDYFNSLPEENTTEFEAKISYLINKMTDIYYTEHDLNEILEKDNDKKRKYSAFYALQFLYRYNKEFDKMRGMLKNKKYKDDFAEMATYSHLELLYQYSYNNGSKLKVSHIDKAYKNARDSRLEDHARVVHFAALITVEGIKRGLFKLNRDEYINKAMCAVDSSIKREREYPKSRYTKSCLLFFRRDYDKALKEVGKAMLWASPKSLNYGVNMHVYQSHEMNILIERGKRDTESNIDEVKKIVENNLIRNIELVAFFAGVIALVLGSIQIAAKQHYDDAAKLIIVLFASLLCVYSALGIILHGVQKKTLLSKFLPNLIVFALGLIVNVVVLIFIFATKS